MDSLELLIRKRLGQKSFVPINGRKHKRFDFSCNRNKNKKIIKLFDDFELLFKVDVFTTYGGKILEIFEINFHKGGCELSHEEIDIDEHFDCRRYQVTIKDYSGYGTVEIIKDIILKFSTNYKEIIREEKLNKLLKEI